MKGISGLLLLTVTGLLSSCGFPAHDLNQFEKEADIAWVYGTFERNYAPAEWKVKEGGATLAQAKKDCEDSAANITKADEFIAHLGECVNRFHDAHTRTMASGASLPEMASVAYLGFTTQAVRADVNIDPAKKDPTIQNVLLVKGYLPTTDVTEFPVKVGDLIIEVNDKPVADYLASELVKYGNLGQADSSLVVAGAGFPLRSSYAGLIPKEADIKLTIKRGDYILTTLLPWTVKDALAFQNDEAAAKKLATPEPTKPATPATVGESLQIRWDGNELITTLMQVANQFRESAGLRTQILLQNTFERHNLDPIQHMVQTIFADKQPEALPVETSVNVAKVTSLNMDLAPFVARVFIQEDGSRVGYIRLETFSLDNTASDKLSELIVKFNKMKVKGVILDALNNGGGSLVAGLRMANVLTEKALDYPKMQLGLNDNWMNSFHADSLYSAGDKGSDARRTMAARVYKTLVEDQKAGLRLSRAISTTELDPFILTQDKTACKKAGKCLGSSVKLVLMVNEMCASMCDIFASIFHDNKMGTIVGSQTMGAGGNVVMHMSAPVTQIMMNQTESLIVDVAGNYLENNGVKPDEAVDTLLDIPTKYATTYKKAFEVINK